MNEPQIGVKGRLMQFINYLHLSTRAFENQCGLSNGFGKNISKGIGADKLGSILRNFPQLNSEWLIEGKGAMVTPSQSVGDVSDSTLTGVNVHGDNISINSADEDEPKNLEALIKIVEAYQRSTERFQDQIDRLLTLLENR